MAATIVAALVGSAVALSPDLSSPAAATSPQPLYYLALGDSLAAGTGASTTGNRYVNVLYQHELSRLPSLQLVNIACGGATLIESQRVAVEEVDGVGTAASIVRHLSNRVGASCGECVLEQHKVPRLQTYDGIGNGLGRHQPRG